MDKFEFHKQEKEIHDQFSHDRNEDVFFEKLISLRDEYIKSLEKKVNQIMDEKARIMTENIHLKHDLNENYIIFTQYLTNIGVNEFKINDFEKIRYEYHKNQNQMKELIKNFKPDIITGSQHCYKEEKNET